MSELRLVPIELKKPDARPLQVVSLGSLDNIHTHTLRELPKLEMGQKNRGGHDADRQQIDTGDSIRQKIETAAGPIWLEGNTLLCGCPDCGASMSIRLILSAADCWRCQTSIRLNAEQIAAAEQLLEQSTNEQEPVKAPVKAPAPLPTRALTQTPSEPAPDRPRLHTTVARTHPASTAQNGSAPALPPANRRRPTAAELMTRQRVRAIQSQSSARVWLDQMLKMTPAWLISFVIHFVGLLLLALFWIPSDETADQITLSTLVRPYEREGGDLLAIDSDDPHYDLPTPPEADVSDRNIRAALAKADQEARALRLDENPRAPLGDLAAVKKQLATESGKNFKFAARDPRLRVDLVQNEGGTVLTEAAVARGLRWLSEHQNQDGSWSLHNWKKCKSPNNEGDPAATALALLPFLGAGQTHEFGLYKDTVAQGLKWMMEHQAANGDLRDSLKGNQMGMYAHGQGTIVLVEALAMTGDERFREPAQKAIDFICAAQHQQGGWRYNPGEAGDTSVFGWQMMALQSASSPGLGLSVPDETLKLADYYLDLAQAKDGIRYQYLPNNGSPTETMTAEALLCRMYLGWRSDDPRLMAGVTWLTNEHMPSKNRKNIYYWYYATQTLHHFGGPEWEKWNATMRDLLVDLQEENGSEAGSWNPAGFQYQQGDRIYVTALAVCSLEVYYRHLPLFKQLDIDRN
jgi:hypothetical protein